MSAELYNNQERHLVAVDCIIFGYEDGELKLLLFHRGIVPAKGEWSLLGGWVNTDETIEDAAERVLMQTTGLKDIYLEQVHVFSEPERDPGGRVISIAFNALVDIKKHNKELVREHGAHWWGISELPKLIFDHDQMVSKALEKLRQKASYEIIGDRLLPEYFTISDLRTLYNAIFQTEFDPGNFRKKMLTLDALKKTNRKDTSGSKKGAFYYKFKTDSKINMGKKIKIV
ncbi:MAG: NUDIX hydrolase [Bacteroidales bacterium]|nr:NUDIX hydrolase [Bacteroidales bacterium]